MAGADCREINFGYESGSQEVLNAIKKGITVEQSLRATRLAKQAGLKIHGYFMIGNVGETEASVEPPLGIASIAAGRAMNHALTGRAASAGIKRRNRAHA